MLPLYPLTSRKKRLAEPVTSQIKIIHEYVHTFSSGSYSKHSPNKILRRLTDITKCNLPGISVRTAEISEPISLAGLANAEVYVLPELSLIYCANNIPDILTKNYIITNYRELPGDQESSALLHIRGRPIPIKY
jgi:hypothetical protein